MIERHVLITNLWHVNVDDLRAHCNALLLVREVDPRDSNVLRCQLQGFGTEAAWLVFNRELPTIDHEVRDDQIVLLAAGGRVLQSAPKIHLHRDDIDRPLAVQTFEWDSEDRDRSERYRAVCTALEESVASHWHAPYMPRLVHMEPAQSLAFPSRATGRAR